MGGIFSINSKIESCETIDECYCDKKSEKKKAKEMKSTPKKDKPENVVLKSTC